MQLVEIRHLNVELPNLLLTKDPEVQVYLLQEETPSVSETTSQSLAHLPSPKSKWYKGLFKKNKLPKVPFFGCPLIIFDRSSLRHLPIHMLLCVVDHRLKAILQVLLDSTTISGIFRRSVQVTLVQKVVSKMQADDFVSFQKTLPSIAKEDLGLLCSSLFKKFLREYPQLEEHLTCDIVAMPDDIYVIFKLACHVFCKVAENSEETLMDKSNILRILAMSFEANTLKKFSEGIDLIKNGWYSLHRFDA